MNRRLRAVLGLLLTAVMVCTGIGFASAASFHDSGMRGSRDGITVEQVGDTWVALRNGSFDPTYTGIAQNKYGWWKVTDGFVDFGYTGVAKNDYGWWRVKKGKVDFNANGIYSNEYGKWYVKNGKVDFSKNGKVTFNGKKYQVTNGKATRIK